MPERKGFFGDYHEMAHILTMILAFDQVFKTGTVQTCS